MTHSDIYTKFMIEYDKANVTSSYPSLTEYEIATVLDKAYNALIAQKVTGNNVRRAGFEADLKAVTDLEPLVVKTHKPLGEVTEYLNVSVCELPPDCLYYISASLDYTPATTSIVGDSNFVVPVKLVSHDTALKFIVTAYNIPWIKIPVCYIQEGKLYIVYDPVNKPGITIDNECMITYIKTPNTFVKDQAKMKDGETFFNGTGSMFEFECNDTVAEELVSLAVTFALENVESARLNAKLNMRGLEA